MAGAMRAFLAVDLRDTLGQAAHAWGRAVAHTLGPRRAGALSWTPAERVHVTLRFFGEIDVRLAEAVVRALAADAPAPFELVLGGGGTFPPSGRPRVLWLGFTDGREELLRLHAWARARLEGVVAPERRETFAPHVTVARVRREDTPGLGAALREAAARTPRPEARTSVQALTLFESVLSPKGPSYTPLVRFALRAP
jgi:2'-5' RNA ligase